MLKSYWLTAIFLHLPVRAEALQAALGTAGHHSFMKGFALHPFCDGGGVGNAPINCNLKHRPKTRSKPPRVPAPPAKLLGGASALKSLPHSFCAGRLQYLLYGGLKDISQGDRALPIQTAGNHRAVA